MAAWAHWSSVQFLNYLETFRHLTVRDENTSVVEIENTTLINATYPSSPLFAASLGLLLFAPLGWFLVVGNRVQSVIPSMSKELVDQFPGRQASFVKEFGNVVGFETQSRSRDDLLGQYSYSWRLATAGGVEIISFDMPFRGWHPLWGCYELAGWSIIEKSLVQVATNDSGDDWPVYEAILSNDFGENAVLHFVLFDRNGMPFIHENTRMFLAEKDRKYRTLYQEVLALSNQLQGDRLPITYQLQRLAKSNEPFVASDILRLREQFSKLRGAAIPEIAPSLRSLPDGF